METFTASGVSLTQQAKPTLATQWQELIISSSPFLPALKVKTSFLHLCYLRSAVSNLPVRNQFIEGGQVKGLAEQPQGQQFVSRDLDEKDIINIYPHLSE